MKTEEELKKILGDLDNFLSSRDVTVIEVTMLLETVKFQLNMEAWEKEGRKQHERRKRGIQH